MPGLFDSIVDGKTGILVDCEALSMADGVASLLRNKKLYIKMSNEAKLWFEWFTWDKAGEKSYALITKIISS